MAEQFFPVRSVKGYFKEFGVEAIGKKKADPDLVRKQILDAFHKEIFNQLALRFGDPELLAKDISTIDPETKRQVDNILSNSVRKWKRLCIEFAKYKETHSLIMPSDLMTTLEDVVKYQVDNEEAPEDVVLLEE